VRPQIGRWVSDVDATSEAVAEAAEAALHYTSSLLDAPEALPKPLDRSLALASLVLGQLFTLRSELGGVDKALLSVSKVQRRLVMVMLGCPTFNAQRAGVREVNNMLIDIDVAAAVASRRPAEPMGE
jgi:hypothetical protein